MLRSLYRISPQGVAQKCPDSAGGFLFTSLFLLYSVRQRWLRKYLTSPGNTFTVPKDNMVAPGATYITGLMYCCSCWQHQQDAIQ